MTKVNARATAEGDMPHDKKQCALLERCPARTPGSLRFQRCHLLARQAAYLLWASASLTILLLLFLVAQIPLRDPLLMSPFLHLRKQGLFHRAKTCLHQVKGEWVTLSKWFLPLSVIFSSFSKLSLLRETHIDAFKEKMGTWKYYSHFS